VNAKKKILLFSALVSLLAISTIQNAQTKKELEQKLKEEKNILKANEKLLKKPIVLQKDKEAVIWGQCTGEAIQTMGMADKKECIKQKIEEFKKQEKEKMQEAIELNKEKITELEEKLEAIK